MKKFTNLCQIPIGTKVKAKSKKTFAEDQVGTVIKLERIICNKPHRVVHTVLFGGEDQYDFKANSLTLCFKAPELIIVEEV